MDNVGANGNRPPVESYNGSPVVGKVIITLTEAGEVRTQLDTTGRLMFLGMIEIAKADGERMIAKNRALAEERAAASGIQTAPAGMKVPRNLLGG